MKSRRPAPETEVTLLSYMRLSTAAIHNRVSMFAVEC